MLVRIVFQESSLVLACIDCTTLPGLIPKTNIELRYNLSWNVTWNVREEIYSIILWFSDRLFVTLTKAKEKYRGVFEIQKSGDKTSSGEIGLDIRTHASPKVGQDQVSGGVSVLCWHAAPVIIFLDVYNLLNNMPCYPYNVVAENQISYIKLVIYWLFCAMDNKTFSNLELSQDDVFQFLLICHFTKWSTLCNVCFPLVCIFSIDWDCSKLSPETNLSNSIHPCTVCLLVSYWSFLIITLYATILWAGEKIV